MSLASIAATPAASTSLTGLSAQKDVVDKQDFLLLLVTQLKNQDPLSPMDGTQFTTQLAQFSALEQLQSINAKMDQLAAARGPLPGAAAVDLIGKTVTVDGGMVTLGAEGSAEIPFTLAGDAGQTLLAVSDPSGRTVRTVNLGPLAAGPQSFVWDGLDNTGQRQPAGTYRVQVNALDASGAPVTSSATVTARITGVSFENGAVMLLAGDRVLPLAGVTRISESLPAPGSAPLLQAGANAAATAAGGTPLAQVATQAAGLVTAAKQI
jgi:flagellar basal-body rod modification protein FlgD